MFGSSVAVCRVGGVASVVPVLVVGRCCCVFPVVAFLSLGWSGCWVVALGFAWFRFVGWLCFPLAGCLVLSCLCVVRFSLGLLFLLFSRLFCFAGVEFTPMPSCAEIHAYACTCNFWWFGLFTGDRAANRSQAPKVQKKGFRSRWLIHTDSQCMCRDAVHAC